MTRAPHRIRRGRAQLTLRLFSVAIAVAVPANAAAQAPAKTSAASPDAPASAPGARAFLDRYCVTCHNDRVKAGGLLLDRLDVAHAAANAETSEKVVRKLRAGMMPPSGVRRPTPEVREAFVSWMETELDRNAVSRPTRPGIHRLNRTEYANVIRDLLGIEIDAAKLLPPDDSTHGFDNMAATLSMSPALLEAYLSAAGKISRLASGSATATTQIMYPVPEDASQNYHVEGLPFGSRGGLLIHHEFPADGEYVFRIYPVTHGNMDNNNIAFGEITGEQLEVSLDGERVKLFDWDKEIGRGYVVRSGAASPRVRVKAGRHAVGVTFLATNFAPGNDLDSGFLRTLIETAGVPGITFFPHVGKVRIDGPFDARPGSETPNRQKIFVCRPRGESDRSACAQKILSALATRAFRRPVQPAEVAGLMRFYRTGAEAGGFDNGIEMALRRLLVDPAFIYRKETEPAGTAPGQAFRISDLELASRLSFFLWSSIPDEELLTAASQNRLRTPAVLERQVRRMLADRRAQALVANFAGQWLNVRALQGHEPVVAFFPDFDDNLRRSLRREVELFFESIVREDRSIKDLLTADYTFVDERLAKHYGIPNVYGSQFQRVTLGPDLDVRRGLLGKGALLTITSQPTRTSPVARGQYFLQTFLGVTPPQPPLDVPVIPPRKDDATGNSKEPSMRQRMEQHRADPGCAACHKIMDPIGFSLENFDAVGFWRTTDEGVPIDAAGELVDGTALNGPTSLRDALLRYSDQYVRVVTEKLLTYALGRGTEDADMPIVRSIVRDAARDNYRISSIVLGIVKSAPFQMSVKSQADDDRPAAR